MLLGLNPLTKVLKFPLVSDNEWTNYMFIWMFYEFDDENI